MAKFGRAAAIQDLNRVLVFRNELARAASLYGVRTSVLAGIMSRETRGLPKFFIGDGGHGCGPMQIDDRSFPAICAAYKAGKRTNEDMISFGAAVLREKLDQLRKNRHLANPAMHEMAAISAYNCGASNVASALAARESPDKYTTGKNYASDVLERAQYFREQGF